MDSIEIIQILRKKYKQTFRGLSALVSYDHSFLSKVGKGKIESPEELYLKLQTLLHNFQEPKIPESCFTSGMAIVKHAQRKRGSLSKIWSHKNLEEVGGNFDRFTTVLKYVKLSYRHYREDTFNERLPENAWHLILNSLKWESHYVALTNYLLEWNYKRGGDKLVKQLITIPKVFFEKAVMPCFTNIAFPNQILTDATAEEWEKYWSYYKANNPHFSINTQVIATPIYKPVTTEERYNLEHYGYRNRTQFNRKFQECLMLNGLFSDEVQYLSGIRELWDKDVNREKKDMGKWSMYLWLEEKLREENKKSGNFIKKCVRLKNVYQRHDGDIEKVVSAYSTELSLPKIKQVLSWDFNVNCIKQWEPTEDNLYDLYKDYVPILDDSQGWRLNFKERSSSFEVKEKTLRGLIESWYVNENQ